MATPALAALLWLGSIPQIHVIVIGLVTAFAGYTSVYALNDVIELQDRSAQKSASSDLSVPPGTSMPFASHTHGAGSAQV